MAPSNNQANNETLPERVTAAASSVTSVTPEQRQLSLPARLYENLIAGSYMQIGCSPPKNRLHKSSQLGHLTLVRISNAAKSLLCY